MIDFDFSPIPEEIRDEQIREFQNEQITFAKHRQDAAQLVANELPQDARILILDTSQGAFIPAQVGDDKLVDLVVESQFGGGPITHGSAFRALLGCEQDDPRVVIWDCFKNPEGKGLPALDTIDAFITTGGPAMPSELIPGHETQNTHWLRAVVSKLDELKNAKIAGANFCLGHQLWNFTLGAEVCRVKPQREFGTVKMRLTAEAKKLQLLQNIADADDTFLISSSHSEAVKRPADYDGAKVLVENDYFDFQGFAFPLIPGTPLEEADAKDELIISFQNHPEMLGLCLEVLRRLRRDAIKAEGLPIDRMIFRDTPTVRRLFLNFIQMAARRAKRRLALSESKVA